MRNTCLLAARIMKRLSLIFFAAALASFSSDALAQVVLSSQQAACVIPAGDTNNCAFCGGTGTGNCLGPGADPNNLDCEATGGNCKNCKCSSPDANTVCSCG